MNGLNKKAWVIELELNSEEAATRLSIDLHLNCGLQFTKRKKKGKIIFTVLYNDIAIPGLLKHLEYCLNIIYPRKLSPKQS